MFESSDLEELQDYPVALLGPLLNSYFAALCLRCQERTIPMIGFVSREGVFLRDAFASFCAARGIDQPAVHVPASRSFLLKLLIDKGGLEFAAKDKFQGALARFFADRFSIYEWGDDSAVTNWSQIEISLPDDVGQLTSILPLIRSAVVPDIEEKREAYRAYLGEIGFVENGLLADVGYSGSLQALLGAIVGRPLDAFYIATTRKQTQFGEKTGDFDALFPGIGILGKGPALLDNSMLLEIIMSADHGQVDDFDNCGGLLPWQFRHGPKGRSQYSHQIIKLAQSAATGYLVETANVPIADLVAQDHLIWLYSYVNRLMSMPAMAPKLLIDIGDADDRVSGLGFINPWQYLASFRN